MKLRTTGHPLDGLDGLAGAREADHQAGKNGLAVDQDRAGATLSELAAMFRPGEIQVLTEDLEQCLVWIEGHFDVFAVDAKPHQDSTEGKGVVAHRDLAVRAAGGVPSSPRMR